MQCDHFLISIDCWDWTTMCEKRLVQCLNTGTTHILHATRPALNQTARCCIKEMGVMSPHWFRLNPLTCIHLSHIFNSWFIFPLHCIHPLELSILCLKNLTLELHIEHSPTLHQCKYAKQWWNRNKSMLAPPLPEPPPPGSNYQNRPLMPITFDHCSGTDKQQHRRRRHREAPTPPPPVGLSGHLIMD